MRTHLRKLMEKNDGMTLVEVIVAFAIFAIAILILASGLSISGKPMMNSAQNRDAGQQSSSNVETLSDVTETEGTAIIKVLPGGVAKNLQGVYKKGTTEKSIDAETVSMEEFVLSKSTSTPIPNTNLEGKALFNSSKYYGSPAKEFPGILQDNGQIEYNKYNQINAYLETCGMSKLTQVALDETLNIKSNIDLNQPDYVNHVFFLASAPFMFTGNDAALTISKVNFICMGSTTADSAVSANIVYQSYNNGSWNGITQQNKFTINAKSNGSTNNQNGTILWFPRKMTITFNLKSQDLQYSATQKVEIDSGFYQLGANDSIQLLSQDINTVLQQKRITDDEKIRQQLNDYGVELN